MPAPPQTGLIALRTDAIAVDVRPTEGGRVSSLRCVASGKEFLTQPRSSRQSLVPGQQAQFRNGPCAGIEDCLPTVGACDEQTEGGPAPDHGDLWQLPWSVLEQTEDVSVSLEVRCFSRPLRVRKRIDVQGRILRIAYEVRNTGPEPTSLLFALHPLLAIAAGDRVVLPREINALALTYARARLSAQVGRTISWPATRCDGEPTDLSVTGGATDGFAAMLYSPRLQHGLCGLYRVQAQQGILLRFDIASLPYLGIWLCYGGWPEPHDGAPQYAVALEPATAPCNTLAEAQRAGAALQLQPGQRASWQVAFELMPPGQSYADFLRDAQLAETP